MKYLLILRLHARFLLHYVKILFKYFYLSSFLSISSYSRGFIDSLHRSFLRKICLNYQANNIIEIIYVYIS